MSDRHRLIKLLEKLETEKVNPDTIDIDRLTPLEIVRKISDQDKTVADVVAQALQPIAQAAEIFSDTIRNEGRVFYLGAGTSGRLGVLDAAECPPTFGTGSDQIIGVISGGYDTLVVAKEGVEDDKQAAQTDLKQQALSKDDFVIGIAASRRTPYTISGLRYAQSLRCRTAFIICNEAGNLEFTPDVLIELPVGPEVIAGSTRMKSATAQKMALNMISTTAMVLLGKTYGNLMIDLECRSEKLAARSGKMLMDLLDVPLGEADELLEKSGGSVKLALVMHRHNCDKNEAQRKLDQVGGFIARLE